ncbi:MAG: chalcone isomerase family protein [Chlamydiales bacterium]|nr:chalcone isomerase family protein [Chlamydiales bacterium]
MKSAIGLFFSLTVLYSISLFGAAPDTVRDDSTGVTFPSDVSFNYEGKDYKLEATGVATRSKFFAKIYSVAHYLQDAAQVQQSDAFNIILQDDKAKQLSIKWVRALEPQKIVQGYRDSFNKTLSADEQRALGSHIEEYLGFFNESVKKGDETQIRWIPGGHILVFFNGEQVGHLHDPAFAKALWNIWFSDDGVVKRDHLVSLLK